MSAGGLILPKSDNNIRVYEIIEAPDNPEGLEKGDLVLVSRHRTLEAEIGGETVCIMSYEDVLAGIERGEAVSALSQDK